MTNEDNCISSLTYIQRKKQYTNTENHYRTRLSKLYTTGKETPSTRTVHGLSRLNIS